MQKILVTGGSGLIGKELTRQLKNKGYEVAILSRNTKATDVKVYYWDISQGQIDTEAIKSVDYIAHLAGENVSAKRWTAKQKVIIENSRVKSAQLLYQSCLELNHWPKAFITSSGTGYYGTFTSDTVLTEKSPVGNDFLALICKKWEAAADLFANKNIRTVKIRTGAVLSNKGGAYAKMAKPAKWGLAAPLGSGKQYMPWIHIDDIVNIYVKAIEDENIKGAFNGVAPEHITNKQLTKTIAKGLKKPYFLPNVPAFALRAIFGQMASIILEDSRVSADKIKDTGYEFRFPDLKSAIKALAGK